MLCLAVITVLTLLVFLKDKKKLIIFRSQMLYSEVYPLLSAYLQAPRDGAGAISAVTEGCPACCYCSGSGSFLHHLFHAGQSSCSPQALHWQRLRPGRLVEMLFAFSNQQCF